MWVCLCGCDSLPLSVQDKLAHVGVILPYYYTPTTIVSSGGGMLHVESAS